MLMNHVADCPGSLFWGLSSPPSTISSGSKLRPAKERVGAEPGHEGVRLMSHLPACSQVMNVSPLVSEGWYYTICTHLAMFVL
jgi:hypothetical protein